MPSGERVRRAALVLHGRRDTVAEAVPRVRKLAEQESVELVEGDQDMRDADLALVLGGDGTMLRTLGRFLGTGIPVAGVNFGAVGFLTSIPRDHLEDGLRRVFAGDYDVLDLPTLEAEAGEQEHARAVNDIVAASSTLGRMVTLAWSVGGEELGELPCDGVLCATPSGSTAYNLSNGGPVLVWGLEALALTFIAPHSLHARPLVVPRGKDVVVENRTPNVTVTMLADGLAFAELRQGESATIRLAEERSRLATLSERTFFRRYHETFTT